MRDGAAGGNEGGLVRGIVLIVLVGTALGVGYNGLGRSSRPARGLPWIGEDKLAAMPSLEGLAEADGTAGTDEPAGGYDQITDPMAVGTGARAAGLPEIPSLDRPIQIRLDAVKALYDAGALVLVDAREAAEFAEGHIPGALSMPFDEVTAEPERLGVLDPGGRAIVTYCGGGACELSLNLAWELIYAGKSRVTVYAGGFPEWVEAGYPVEQGGGRSP